MHVKAKHVLDEPMHVGLFRYAQQSNLAVLSISSAIEVSKSWHSIFTSRSVFPASTVSIFQTWMALSLLLSLRSHQARQAYTEFLGPKVAMKLPEFRAFLKGFQFRETT